MITAPRTIASAIMSPPIKTERKIPRTSLIIELSITPLRCCSVETAPSEPCPRRKLTAFFRRCQPELMLHRNTTKTPASPPGFSRFRCAPPLVESVRVALVEARQLIELVERRRRGQRPFERRCALAPRIGRRFFAVDEESVDHLEQENAHA